MTRSPEPIAPPADALAKVDVLIYDIQDTGSRSYTYIWHLAEVMAAAAAAGKEVIVFDTPNPLGGNSGRWANSGGEI